ncbi:MAG: proton-conducting transporter membrane subunit [Candidatus Latescibacteria bacterium]|nr:proton-conducting transporter membrane subunit [Candidatus Latescibacterota bacterium]
MTLLLVALGLLVASGTAALLCRRSPRAANLIGAGGAAAACALGLIPAVVGLGGGEAKFDLAWPVPGGSLSLAIDPLTAFFLLPLFALCGLAAVYGAGYLGGRPGRRSPGAPWFFFNWLVAGMVVVVTARNAVLFLLAWEVMSLASYFLVTHEDERPEVREAGWTYLVATHFGNACLIALFALLGPRSLDFADFAPAAPAGLLFVLALIGFGTKAGFVPLHVWLPEAHPAAPSHVSAVMSGVMIKMGIYGLLRTLTWLGPPPLWWGGLLIGIGAASGLFAVLFALAQGDLKRLLAYSSVENTSIIALGLGVGLVGLHTGTPGVAILGFAGALLHVWTHALGKGLLFLGAGAVLHATGTREMDRLGGLSRSMPLTSATFLVGAAAVAGLPPLSGFFSEFLILYGAVQHAGLHSLAAMVALALMSGLAAAVFVRAFGSVFLGAARDGTVRGAHDPGAAMRAPLAILAPALLVLGLATPVLVPALAPVVEQLVSLPAQRDLDAASAPLAVVVLGSVVLMALVALIAGGRRLLLAGRTVGSAVTWDCGYAHPTARMQYTASSFAQPLTALFGPVLRTRETADAPRGLFPDAVSFATRTPDAVRERVWRPLFAHVSGALHAMHRLQHGRLHLYVISIALTLVVLLLWRLS